MEEVAEDPRSAAGGAPAAGMLRDARTPPKSWSEFESPTARWANPFVLRVGQVFTGFGVGCGVGIGVGRPVNLGRSTGMGALGWARWGGRAGVGALGWARWGGRAGVGALGWARWGGRAGVGALEWARWSGRAGRTAVDALFGSLPSFSLGSPKTTNLSLPSLSSVSGVSVIFSPTPITRCIASSRGSGIDGG
ncbi:unnamed protein product [Closterium sp. Yama58-4]|nr:unnamed protein product [Closterium sp. Yama58-4]